jgi:hypothetical protein
MKMNRVMDLQSRQPTAGAQLKESAPAPSRGKPGVLVGDDAGADGQRIADPGCIGAGNMRTTASRCESR